jgi:hypothetical protein
MFRRLFAALFWVLAVTCWYGFAAYALHVPDTLGPVLALGVAAFVAVDPFAKIWTGRPAGR